MKNFTKRKSKYLQILMTFFMVLFMAQIGKGQTNLFTEDFNDATQYTVTLGAEGNDGTADYFQRTDGSNIGITYSNYNGTFYFAGQDTDDTGWTGSAAPAQLSWSSIDISGYTNLKFIGLFGSNSTSGIDDSDYLLIEYQIDAGGWNNLIAFENDGTQYNTYFLEDTDFDGTGDGTQLTSALAEFSKNIAATGTSLDLRFTALVNSGGEDFAIDLFEIEGTSGGSSVSNVSSFAISNITSDKVNLTWTKPTGTHATDWDGVAVYARAASANDADVTGDDGSALDDGSNVYGSGTQDGNSFCVANVTTDTDGDITVTGLSAGTDYYFIAYAYNSSDEWSSGTSEVNQVAAIEEVADLSSSIDDSQITLSWTNPTSNVTDWWDNIIILAKEGSAVDAAPSGDPSLLTANAAFGSGTEVGTGNFIVYSGTGTDVTVTGLTNGTEYNFEVFVYYENTSAEHDYSEGTIINNTPYPAPTCATDLFFSEYIEGGSNNKAVEVFNGTGADIDLTDYKVETFSGGSTTPNYSVTLSGTLSNNDVYIVYNSSAVAAITDVGDVSSTITYYNGDDAVALIKISTTDTLDIIGRIGEDPGSAWTSGSHSTQNKTLVRKTNIIGGVTTNPDVGFPTLETEWDVYDQDNFDYIGSHLMLCPPDDPSGLTATKDATNNTSQINLAWTLNGDSDDVLLVFNTEDTFGTPSGSYVADDAVAGGGTVAYVGGSTSFNHTGLLSGTTYYYKLYSYNATYSAGITANAATDNLPAPTVQMSNIAFSQVSYTTMDISWDNGDGQNRVVIMNTENSFTDPTDGTDPAADNAYAGSGEQVVYNGNNSSFTVTGLTSGMDYWFRGYEYNNADAATLFFNETATNNPNSGTTGEIELPYSWDFDTDMGIFHTYSVSGATKEWYHDTDMMTANGFNSGDLEEDWLIFQPVNLDNYVMESVTFDSYYQYGTDDVDNYLKLMYSTDYTGSGDPGSATWIELSYTQPSGETTWTSSGAVDLSGITGTNVTVAFKYNYNSGSYRRWSIDNFMFDGIADAGAPTVTFDPSDGATEVAKASNITITFNEAVRNIDDSELVDGDLAAMLTLKKGDALGDDVPFTATIDGTKTIITIDPTSDLDSEQAYYVAISASVEDQYDQAITEANATFTVEDYLAPELTFTPADGATGVQINANLTIEFDEAVRKLDNSTVENADLASMLTLKLDDASGVDVAFSATINGTKDVITINPTDDFASLQLYYLAITADLEDDYDNAITATNITFTSADADAPIVTFTPANLTSDVATSSNVLITFSEAVRNTNNSEVVNADLAAMLTFKETDAAGADVAFTATINAGKTEITIDPASDLTELQDYYVAISASLEDLEDNAISAANITFTTADETAPTATFTPVDGATNIANNQIITIEFDEAVQNVDDSEITNANVSNLVTLASVSKAAIAFDATIDATKKIITITPAADLDTATTYTVTLLANTVEDVAGNAITTAQTATFTTIEPFITLTNPVGGESYEGGDEVTITWTSEYVTNVKIELYLAYASTYMELAASVDAALGTYTYTIPEDAVTDAGYKLRLTDAAFSNISTESAAFTVTDAIIPTVLAFAPADNSAGLAQDTSSLVIYFSEPIIVGTGSITLKNYSTDEIVNTYDVTGDNVDVIDDTTVVVTLLAELGVDTEYYVTIHNTAITDISGNAYAGISDKDVWNFTTKVVVENRVFFSEYIEGSSNNKAIEIYNGTGAQIDLSNFTVKLGSNGGTWGNTLTMSGTLDDKATYVIANASANATILGIADITNSVTNYNGDDALGLFNGETLIDVIGVYQEDPGSAWDVAGVSGATGEHTLVRKATIVNGNTDWASSAGTTAENSEWVVFAQDYLDSLGTHYSTPPVLVETITLAGEGGATTIETDKGTLQINATITPEDADNQTLEWSVDDETIASISQTGLLTALNDGTVTVTAAATDGSGVTGTIDITISNQTSVIVVTSITVDGTDGATEIAINGGTLQMIATVLPEDATDKTVTWSVDDETLATINTDGLLTANGAGINGDVVVTATANDGSGKTGTATISISNQLVMITLAELRLEAINTDVVYEIDEELVLTHKVATWPFNKFVQNDSVGIQIYDPDGNLSTQYNIGDGITGLKGTLTEYQGMLEIVPVSDPGAATSTGNVIVPQIVSISEFTSSFEDYESELIKLRDVQFTDADGTTAFAEVTVYEISDGTNTMNFRTSFRDVDYIGDVIPEGDVSIVGIPNSTSDGNYFTARDSADIILAETLVESIVVTSEGDATTITENGGTLQLYATVTPENATNTAVSWSLRNGTGEASISSTGLVTAITNGTVYAKATANDGSEVASDEFEITISGQVIFVETITVNGAEGATSIDTDKGTLQMTATVAPENATYQEVAWSVENVTGAATISATGLLSAVNNGTVLVKATATDESGVFGSLEITLTNQVDIVLIDSIYIYGEDSVDVIDVDNGTLQMYAIVYPENADNQTLVWEVENVTGEATISESGLLTALANGTVLAKALAQDGSQVVGSLEVTISNQVEIILVETIIVTAEGGATSIDEKEGTLQLFANVLPEDATDNSVTWSVDDENIATISETGLLTAVANGTVEAKATANDGSEVEGTISITITNQDISVTEFDLNSTIEIYPNPTEGKFMIEVNNSIEDITVEVVNLFGQLVYNNNIPSENETIEVDLSSNESGIYMIKLSNSKSHTIKRIIIK